MKRLIPIFIFIIVLSSPCFGDLFGPSRIYVTNTIQGVDQWWIKNNACMQGGNCTLSNLNVINNINATNITTEYYNVTGSINLGGSAISDWSEVNITPDLSNYLQNDTDARIPNLYSTNIIATGTGNQMGGLTITKDLTVNGNVSVPYGAINLWGTQSYVYGTIPLYIGSTGDKYGRMLQISKTNFDLSGSSTQYPLEVQARASTGGVRGLYSMTFDARYTGTQAQTGTFTGALGQIYHTGTGTTGDSTGFGVSVIKATNANAGTFRGYQSRGYIENANTGTVSGYYGFWDSGADAEDGTITSVANFYGAAHQKDTGGSVSYAYGMKLDKQTVGSSANMAILLNGDCDVVNDNNAGSAIVFGAGWDAGIGYNGTDLVINPKFTGSGRMVVLGDLVAETMYAITYADLTPAYKGTKQDALTAVNNIGKKMDTKGNAEIDHSTLPELARVSETREVKSNCETDIDNCVLKKECDDNCYKDENGKEICSKECDDIYLTPNGEYCPEICDISYETIEGRSLGGMITVQVEAIQALSDETEMLKSELCDEHQFWRICKDMFDVEKCKLLQPYSWCK